MLSFSKYHKGEQNSTSSAPYAKKGVKMSVVESFVQSRTTRRRRPTRHTVPLFITESVDITAFDDLANRCPYSQWVARVKVAALFEKDTLSTNANPCVKFKVIFGLI